MKKSFIVIVLSSEKELMVNYVFLHRFVFLLLSLSYCEMVASVMCTN